MNNEDEVIEILDDFENNTITIPPINKNVGVQNVVQTSQKEPSSIPETPVQAQVNSNFGVSASEEIKPKTEIYNEVKQLEEVQYEPIKPEKQEIKIEDEQKDENSKSGLGLVIVLFILLAAFIIALPYISKLF